jgi:gamma-glutamylcyclotransferase (GGCT)/AIG2-like uncharacterized protein YtfP
MPLYFAYGANMDVAAMAHRAPKAVALGIARLPRHRFVITEHGYASVVRDPRFVVHGLLWDMPLADIRALDRFEEVDRGLYVKANQPVITGQGPRRALVYLGTGAPGGRPRPGYLEDVIRAATEIGLPNAYLRELAITGNAAMAGAPAGAGKPSAKPASSAASRSAGRAGQAWKWGD